MDLNWQPAPPEDDAALHAADGPPDGLPAGPGPAVRPRGIRRIVASAALVVGLLTIGGASVVAAASPAPAASSGPSASGSAGTTPGTHNCPNMGNGSGSANHSVPSGPNASPGG